MKKTNKIIATIAVVAGLAGGSAILLAQDSQLMAAFEAGTVGVTSSGEYGIVGTASADLRAQVDAANIARRAEYARLAQQRGLPRAQVASQAACQWIGRLSPGRVYQQANGSWTTVTSSPPPLPSYC